MSGKSEQRPPYEARISPEGLILFDRPERVMAELRALAGRPVRVQVAKAARRRTTDQNALLWWQYGEALADGADWVEIASGNPVFRTRKQLHDSAKMWLLAKPVETNRGVIDLLGSTTTLTTQEFSEYLERFAAKMAQYGVHVPAPSSWGR